MSRSKLHDNCVFRCTQVHVINYLAHLYNKSEQVERYLRRMCAIGSIDKKTHFELFTMIEEDLGIPMP